MSLGCCKKITECFVNYSVSLKEVIQLPLNRELAEVVVVTHRTSKYQFERVLGAIEAVASEINSYYIIEEEKTICIKDY